MSSRSESGINLVGHLSSRLGLGVAARMTHDLICAARIRCVTADLVFPGTPQVKFDSCCQRALSVTDLPLSATLLHMNPEQVVSGLLGWDPCIWKAWSRNLIAQVPYWELPILPDLWLKQLAGVDMILAPSGFIQSAVEGGLSQRRNPPEVLHFMQAVEPCSLPGERTRWFGQRSSTTILLGSFDFASDTARKNPVGLLKAFDLAAAGRDDMTLVLKVGHADVNEATKSAMSELMSRAAADSRLMLVNRELSRDEMLSLIASADAYVSLHRAEGLGLGMMEAMSVGTPVIATAWSGNMDFTTSSNSLLVPYTMKSLASCEVPIVTAVYGEVAASAEWAEPDLDAAAGAMRLLAASGELRRQLSKQALMDAESRWAKYRRADALDHVLSAADALDTRDRKRIDRVSRFYAQVRRFRYSPGRIGMDAKRAAVRGLRAAGLKPPAPRDEHPLAPLQIRDSTEGPI